jgi:two-component system response regulator HydG
VQTKKGRFELAEGGTLFLDEVGEMTLSTQTKVLRVLQEREVERLGGTSVVPVDVRVVCATNRNLEQAILAGTFREDLYYRLNVVRIRMPSLRDRPEDVPVLARHFLDVYAMKFGKPRMELPEGVRARMVSYPWPGNVRELENGIARGVVLENMDVIVPRTGPAREAEDELLGDMQGLLSLPYRDAKRRVLERFERFYLLALMERAEQNVSQAAREARMDRKNFWVKLKGYVRSSRDEGAPVGLAGGPAAEEEEED